MGWAFPAWFNPADATLAGPGEAPQWTNAGIVVDVLPDSKVSYVMSEGISVVVEPQVRGVASEFCHTY